MSKRVVITGVGTLNPLGNNAQVTWKNALQGQSGISLLDHTFEKEQSPVNIAGEVKPFDQDFLFFSEKDASRIDRYALLALYSARQAFEDSGIVSKEEIGCILGTGLGGFKTLEEQHSVYKEKGAKRISPFFIQAMLPSTATGLISLVLKLEGPSFSVASACASSLHAQGIAFDYIQSGRLNVCLTGGAESTLTAYAIGGFASMKALSRNTNPQEASRPFDSQRDGFVMSEGSAVFVFEEFEHAKKRGAKIYAEVLGYGASSDAFHMTAPREDGAGASSSMEKALKLSSLNKEDIDYINMHGTSTPLGDTAETQAIKKVFKNYAYSLSCNSTKSMTGHLLGAAGALETLFCIQSLQNNIILPTINLRNADITCDLNYTPLVAQEKKITYAMNNSFGFGGTNCSMIFKKV